MSELVIDGLSKTFSNGRSRHAVLRDLSLTIKPGEFVSLVGPSGCGKTTLLSIIAGFMKPTSGQVKLAGSQVRRPGPDRAFVFQNYALFPWMTVRSNILYPMKLKQLPLPRVEEELKNLLRLANLEGTENLFPHQLSGGMKQRTGVIRALACNPAVLLMDEPLGALDMLMRRRLQEDLETIFMRDTVTVLMVTHDVDEAVFLSDRVVVMSSSGELVADMCISLKRPRDRASKEYSSSVNRLTELLHGKNNIDERRKCVPSIQSEGIGYCAG
jgi:NitT/TauT family transport system ATP-binding protein